MPTQRCGSGELAVEGHLPPALAAHWQSLSRQLDRDRGAFGMNQDAFSELQPLLRCAQRVPGLRGFSEFLGPGLRGFSEFLKRRATFLWVDASGDHLQTHSLEGGSPALHRGAAG